MEIIMKECPNCGAEARDDQKFCESCGHDFRNDPVQQPVNYQQMQAAPGQYAGNQQVQTVSGQYSGYQQVSVTDPNNTWQPPSYTQDQGGGFAPAGAPTYGNYVQPVPSDTGFGDWMLTLFLMAIPIVGFILLIIWSAGNSASESKRNWARAQLVWLIIWTILGFVGCVAMVAMFASIFGGF